MQKTCPVMVGNPIDRSISSTYQGKTVYFCCVECKRKFDAAPEKYVDRLPQFAGAQQADGQSHGFAWGRLVKPLGIATLVLLLTTASAGFFRRWKPRLLLKWHKRLAPATVIVALCHAALVLFFH
ncbi:YHS domain-containing protein [bacterium]|nr:YHS domain-containing protein [bacterium]